MNHETGPETQDPRQLSIGELLDVLESFPLNTETAGKFKKGIEELQRLTYLPDEKVVGKKLLNENHPPTEVARILHSMYSPEAKARYALARAVNHMIRYAREWRQDRKNKRHGQVKKYAEWNDILIEAVYKMRVLKMETGPTKVVASYCKRFWNLCEKIWKLYNNAPLEFSNIQKGLLAEVAVVDAGNRWLDTQGLSSNFYFSQRGVASDLHGIDVSLRDRKSGKPLRNYQIKLQKVTKKSRGGDDVAIEINGIYLTIYYFHDTAMFDMFTGRPTPLFESQLGKAIEPLRQSLKSMPPSEGFR